MSISDKNSATERYLPELQNELWGIRDNQTREWVVAPECDEISFDFGSIFTNGIGWFSMNGKFGIFNHHGEKSNMLFDEILSDCHGVVIVKHDNQKGFIDKQGMFTTLENQAHFRYAI